MTQYSQQTEAQKARLVKISPFQHAMRRSELGALSGMILVFIIFTIIAGDSGMFSPRGVMNWTETSAQLGVIAIGACLLMIAGEFDLSVGSMIGFSGMVMALLVKYGLPGVGPLDPGAAILIGFVLSIGVWSLATIAHAFAQGVLSLSIFRAILGVAEAGNWPGAAKGNAEWFPTKERALAQGIFNSGAAIGGIIAIPLIAYLTVYFSWQMVFVFVGALGFLWLVPWLILVKAP
ncbi:MAG: MFS transporter, partial [Pseudomonadota bacterium]